MTIMVDDLMVWPTKIRCFKGGSCHLTTDGPLEELHIFAARIGLKREWFQEHRVTSHYDLTPKRRVAALALGAVHADASTNQDTKGRDSRGEGANVSDPPISWSTENGVRVGRCGVCGSNYEGSHTWRECAETSAAHDLDTVTRSVNAEIVHAAEVTALRERVVTLKRGMSPIGGIPFVPLTYLRWVEMVALPDGSQAQVGPKVDAIAGYQITLDHVWIIRELVHWRAHAAVSEMEMADYVIRKAEKNDLSADETRSLLMLLDLDTSKVPT
jgi:hypothetical protein